MNRVVLPILLVLSAAGCQREHTPVGGATPAPPPAQAATPSPAASTAVSTPAAAAPEVVNGPSLFPKDEGPSDASFRDYRAKLIEAVKAKNVDGVVALTDPGIRTSFGEGGGVAEFRRLLARPEVSRELEQVLSMGGSFRGDGENRMFWAPYVYSAWPEERDAFAAVAVIGEGIPLRSSADEAAPVIATLNYDIVQRISQPGQESAWVEVKTYDGRSGFVPVTAVRSPIDHRAGFAKRGGQWRMTSFVAGD